MAGFLVDEDLPRSLAPLLREAGFDAEDVRDVGLRGRRDDQILQYATSRSLAVLTGDVGFGNTTRFPLGAHTGVVVARFPNEVPISVLNDAIVRAIRGLSEEDISGSVVIVEPGRIRVRRSA